MRASRFRGEPGIAQEFVPNELPDDANPIGYFDRIVIVEENDRLYGAEVSRTGPRPSGTVHRPGVPPPR